MTEQIGQRGRRERDGCGRGAVWCVVDSGGETEGEQRERRRGKERTRQDALRKQQKRSGLRKGVSCVHQSIETEQAIQPASKPASKQREREGRHNKKERPHTRRDRRHTSALVFGFNGFVCFWFLLWVCRFFPSSSSQRRIGFHARQGAGARSIGVARAQSNKRKRSVASLLIHTQNISLGWSIGAGLGRRGGGVAFRVFGCLRRSCPGPRARRLLFRLRCERVSALCAVGWVRIAVWIKTVNAPMT